MGTKKKGKAALKASKKAFKDELIRFAPSANRVSKAAKVKTKKVEIRGEGQGWSFVYAFARPNAETWATGYARPFTAKRGAMRHFKEFIAKGGVLQFINNY
jgi:hypothetical protein